jgi:hypothetical protein
VVIVVSWAVSERRGRFNNATLVATGCFGESKLKKEKENRLHMRCVSTEIPTYKRQTLSPTEIGMTNKEIGRDRHRDSGL